MMDSNKNILEKIRALPVLSQVNKIGIVSVETVEKIPNSLNLREILPGAKSVVVLLAHILDEVVKQAGKPPSESGVSYTFLRYQTIREMIWAADDLGRWLSLKGERSIPLVDLSKKSFPTSGGTPDLRVNSPFAVAAGLGELGLSGLLLTPEYGPRQRFCFLLTTAQLPETVYNGPALCTKCGKCADACPVQALDTEKLEKISIGNKEYLQYARQETRCRWARSLGMVSEAGNFSIGWKDPKLPIPDKLSEKEAEKALQHKDPIQVKLYHNPLQFDIIIERCLQICHVGKI